MQLYYIDSPAEKASLAILIGLGFSFEDGVSVYGKRPGPVPLGLEQCVEGKSPATFLVTDGMVCLDVRDSGDCWIQCVLPKGTSASVPVGKYFRFTQTIDRMGMKCRFSVTHTTPATALVSRYHHAADGVQLTKYHSVRELVCELCRQFFMEKWVTGTGGSICIKHGDRIYMTPSGVQKERIEPDDIYVLDTTGAVLSYPAHKPGKPKAPKLTDCAPLFLHAFQQRNAGSVLHSHAYSCVLAAALFDGHKEFRISHQEMIKGIVGHGYTDELVVPIIENTPHEFDLADSLGEAIRNNPKAVAVLVRRHGLYVWGDDWQAAKRHAECLHYLFEIAVQMKSLGLSFIGPPLCGSTSTQTPATVTATAMTTATANGKVEGGSAPTSPSKKMKKRAREDEEEEASDANKAGSAGSASASHKVVLLDIEGTTTPITFVKAVLFPYAAKHLREHLKATWATDKTKGYVAALVKQAAGETDKAAPTPMAKTVEGVTKYCQWLISVDRKAGALKQMQGDIWKVGYDKDELKAIVYSDVPRLFKRVVGAGNKICIYSSGSRGAQKMLFQNSDQGDLTGDISAYFDTKVGPKREAPSYAEILLYLGVDKPSDVLFLTDVVEEAAAAKAVGMDAVISDRPGNSPLPPKHGFRVVTDFDDIN